MVVKSYTRLFECNDYLYISLASITCTDALPHCHCWVWWTETFLTRWFEPLVEFRRSGITQWNSLDSYKEVADNAFLKKLLVIGILWPGVDASRTRVTAAVPFYGRGQNRKFRDGGWGAKLSRSPQDTRHRLTTFPTPVSGYTWGEKLLTVGGEGEFMFHTEPVNKTWFRQSIVLVAETRAPLVRDGACCPANNLRIYI